NDQLVPLYLEIEGMRPQQLRNVIAEALPSVAGMVDPVPAALRARHALPDLAETIRTLHAPPPGTPLAVLEGRSRWHERLIYEEWLLLMLAVLRRKAEALAEPGKRVPLGAPLAALAKELFEFQLTGAQARALLDIERDLSRDLPMQRL